MDGLRENIQRKNTWNRVKSSWQLYVFLLVPMGLVFVFHYIPIWGAQIAFKDFSIREGIIGSKWVGFDQFTKFFKNYMFARLIKNTLIISIYDLVVSFPFPIILALAINTMKENKFRHLMQFTLYVPHFISVVVMIGIVTQLFNSRIGLYSSIYGLFNNGAYPQDILALPNAFRHIYVWSGVWQNMGWGTIIYIAALSSSDVNLHEAMQIDGATRLQRVIHLDFQCILPTATILLILSCGSIMSVGFEKMYLLQNDLNISASEVISTYVYKMGIKSELPNYSYSSAIGLFNSVINFTILILVNKVSQRVQNGTSLW